MLLLKIVAWRYFFFPLLISIQLLLMSLCRGLGAPLCQWCDISRHLCFVSHPSSCGLRIQPISVPSAVVSCEFAALCLPASPALSNALQPHSEEDISPLS